MSDHDDHERALRRSTDWREAGSIRVTSPVQCAICRWRHAGERPPVVRSAFERIPIENLENRYDHRKLYPGDHEVRIERKPDPGS